jgi:uncharacterized membrane protein (UPF0127 family)
MQETHMDFRKSGKVRLLGAAIAVAAVAAAMIATRHPTAEEYKSNLPVETLVVKTAGGDVSFNVEVAVKQADKEIGLMYRKSMAKDHGMLFEMSKEPEPVSFWMKNTYISLDMLFVARDGRIVNIHHKAIPEDVTPLPSREPVTGVVEINGGLADELGIKIGDKVVHAYFK